VSLGLGRLREQRRKQGEYGRAAGKRTGHHRTDGVKPKQSSIGHASPGERLKNFRAYREGKTFIGGALEVSGRRARAQLESGVGTDRL
jgi:hypothetical protein